MYLNLKVEFAAQRQLVGKFRFIHLKFNLTQLADNNSENAALPSRRCHGSM